MSDLPTGTVTFLFTDIEGSTRLLEQLGDRYADVLAGYRRLLRAAFQQRRAQEVDTQGDALFVVFSRAKDAVAAAVAAQQAISAHRWPEGVAVRARMGLHTGEPISVETGYVGLDVHRAARICGTGHGGQILLSGTTRELVQSGLSEGMGLRDLGAHRLKDLAQPQHLFQLVAPGLASDFPPLKTLDTLPNNLPRQLTSFVGREREMAEVKHLLTNTCLLTLTGAGGSGKTRLALQVAADVLDQYPDGIWQVELAAIADPTLVPQAAASALSMPELPGRSLTETLVDYLRPKSTLLVLDNCEHLLSGCAQFAAALLRACPSLRIVATSREGLGIAGEVTYLVPALSLPDPRHLPAPDQIMRSEAVRLFTERAALSQPKFAVTASNAPAVVQICAQLDGIPLAIELAAARVKALTAQQIAARLGDRLRLLRGSPAALPRHQTLRAAMDWSYDLLSEQGRAMLRRLSVFAGGWTLDAAEAICPGDGVEPSEVLDLLAQLVDKSLVIFTESDGQARYGLLETVRQYGREKFAEAADADNLRRRHRDWYLRMAEDVRPQLDGPAAPAGLALLEREHDNFRAALEWSASDASDQESGLRLALALVLFWEMRGRFTEGRRWLEALVARSGAAPPPLRAAGLNAAGIIAYRQGDHARVSALCSEALALYEAQGNPRGVGRALHFLAHLKQVRGDYAGAAEMMERSVALHREAGNAAELANSVDCLGEIARSAGDYGRAGVLTEQALTLYRDMGHLRGTAHALHNLAYVRLREGDAAGARALFRESLVLVKEMGYTRDQVFAVAGLACASLVDVDASRATRLLGAVEALLAMVEVRLEPAEAAEFQRAVEAARAQLDPAAFGAAWAAGRAMTPEQAVEYALAEETGSPPTGRADRPSDGRRDILTAREREVAALIAQGSTNREIASRLVVAERTAEGHVQSILNKLGFHSRSQIAAWAVEHGLRTGDEPGARDVPGSAGE